jgi:hypothetical protein
MPCTVPEMALCVESLECDAGSYTVALIVNGKPRFLKLPGTLRSFLDGQFRSFIVSWIATAKTGPIGLLGRFAGRRDKGATPGQRLSDVALVQ